MWLSGNLQELPPPGEAPLPAEGPPHPPPFSQAEFLDSLQVQGLDSEPAPVCPFPHDARCDSPGLPR